MLSLNVVPTVSDGEVVESREDVRRPASGSPVSACVGHARRDPGAARYVARLPGADGRRAEPRELAPPRVGARRRGVRRPATGAYLRPALHVRQRRARRRRDRVRARPDHGHQRADDRAHDDALLDGATAGIASRLDAFGAEQDRREIEAGCGGCRDGS